MVEGFDGRFSLLLVVWVNNSTRWWSSVYLRVLGVITLADRGVSESKRAADAVRRRIMLKRFSMTFLRVSLSICVPFLLQG